MDGGTQTRLQREIHGGTQTRVQRERYICTHKPAAKPHLARRGRRRRRRGNVAARLGPALLPSLRGRAAFGGGATERGRRGRRETQRVGWREPGRTPRVEWRLLAGAGRGRTAAGLAPCAGRAHVRCVWAHAQRPSPARSLLEPPGDVGLSRTGIGEKYTTGGFAARNQGLSPGDPCSAPTASSSPLVIFRRAFDTPQAVVSVAKVCWTRNSGVPSSMCGAGTGWAAAASAGARGLTSKERAACCMFKYGADLGRYGFGAEVVGDRLPRVGVHAGVDCLRNVLLHLLCELRARLHR